MRLSFLSIMFAVFVMVPNHARAVTLLIESTISNSNLTNVNFGNKLFGLVQYETAPAVPLSSRQFDVTRFEILVGDTVVDVEALVGNEFNTVTNDSGSNSNLDGLGVSKQNVSSPIAAFGERIDDFGLTFLDNFFFGYTKFGLSALTSNAITADIFDLIAPAFFYNQLTGNGTAQFLFVATYDGSQVVSDEFDLASLSVVPIPAALPLFGTGLAFMGFIGWRRKRKINVMA